MTHYKSNLRDIEFNLFEVFGRQQLLGSAPHADLDEETVRGILDEVNRLASGPIAESFATGDRNPPVFDPATHSVTMPEAFAKSFKAFIDAESSARAPGRARRQRRAQIAVVGRRRADPRREPGHLDVRQRSGVRQGALANRNARAARVRQAGGRPALDRDDGADRAGRRLRRWRRPHQGDRAAGRHLAHRGRQAVHYQRRARHVREHLPLRARPARRRGPGHQGPVDVPRPQVPGSTPTATSASATVSTSPTSSTRWG